jgi:multicomponent Na+:H+ antiporter subunit E
MLLFLINIILAILWMALTTKFSGSSLLVGFIIGFLILAFCSRVFVKQAYAKKFWYILVFMVFILYELIESSLKVAMHVLKPTLSVRPGVIALPLDCETDLEITLLANLISLTPGTLTLDVSSDKKTLFVHTMYANDIEHERKMMKLKLEKRLLGLTR